MEGNRSAVCQCGRIDLADPDWVSKTSNEEGTVHVFDGSGYCHYRDIMAERTAAARKVFERNWVDLNMPLDDLIQTMLEAADAVDWN